MVSMSELWFDTEGMISAGYSGECEIRISGFGCVSIDSE